MLEMQYPYIEGNIICDGRVHRITPRTVFRIEDLELYLLNYFDETLRTECTTIVQRNRNGELVKVPLIDYDSVTNMMRTGRLRLTEVPVNELFAEYFSGRRIETLKPVKDFPQCLTQARAVIILYIDNMGNIYMKTDGQWHLLSGEALMKIMESYDIEWHMLVPDTLAPPSLVNIAVSRTAAGYIAENTKVNGDGIGYEERYAIGNAHHYSVHSKYTDANGFTRMTVKP